MILAIGVAGYSMWRIDPWAERTQSLPASFTLDLGNQLTIDPALIRYTQTDTIDVGMTEPHAIATGPKDRIYVAGDRLVHVFDPAGRQHRVVQLEGSPTSVAVGGADHVEPGRLYVGADGHVELFDAELEPAGRWEGIGDGAIITSIALSANDVFVADAGNRLVLRYDPAGQLLGRIGQPDAKRQMPGFIVPSPYFDVAVAGDDSLHIVNPGARRIELYTFDGDLQTFWSRAGSTVADFFGCCNPVHLSLLADGRFVTSEKGIPRVKIYSPDGELECFVAGPQQLAVDVKRLGDPRLTQSQSAYDVAVDSQGRVLVLDPAARQVRVFQTRDDPWEQVDEH